MSDPQPMMRCIPDAGPVAARVRAALLEAGVDTREAPIGDERVEYRLMDDDGIVVLSNRPAPAPTEAP